MRVRFSIFLSSVHQYVTTFLRSYRQKHALLAQGHEVRVAYRNEKYLPVLDGLPVVIVNPSLCIGEYDAHTFSGRSVLAFSRYRLRWYTETSFNVVYTGDVGVGHVRAAERGRLGERYLLAGENVTLKEFGTLACRELGMPQTPSAEAIRRAVQWFRQHGMLGKT